MKHKIDYCCINIMGKVRKNNEDNFFAQGRFRHSNELYNDIVFSGQFPTCKKEILAVYDGMGGEACGEVAALLAASHTSLPKGRGTVEESLVRLCYTLNQKVCDYAVQEKISCMGATAAIACFDKDELFVCNLGDSRVYLHRDGALQQLSIDHTAQKEGSRKAPLTQYLGLFESEYILEPSCAHVPYCDKDILLLCSDGLTDMVSDEIIEILLNSAGTLESKAKLLVTNALKNGGIDNITVILCEVKREQMQLFKWLR